MRKFGHGNTWTKKWLVPTSLSIRRKESLQVVENARLSQSKCSPCVCRAIAQKNTAWRSGDSLFSWTDFIHRWWRHRCAIPQRFRRKSFGSSWRRSEYIEGLGLLFGIHSIKLFRRINAPRDGDA